MPQTSLRVNANLKFANFPLSRWFYALHFRLCEVPEIICDLRSDDNSKHNQDVAFTLTCPCGRVFIICRSCYRGHRYCSEPCRKRARLQQTRAANRRHQSSPEGRRDHCDAQRRYRQRCRARSIPRPAQEESVTDQCSLLNLSPPSSDCDPAPTQLHCRICGRSVRFLNPYRRLLPVQLR